MRLSNYLRKASPGFSLVELLVVIAVIGVLSGVLIINLVGVRGRAADAGIKSDFKSLKSALRLYYNDYQQYPASSGSQIMGCGAAGTSACAVGGAFSAAGTTYMGELPDSFAYYSDGEDEFLLIAPLDNQSDQAIAESQAKCNPSGRTYFSGTLDADADYVECEL